MHLLRRGFTLIELLVVLILFLVLGAAVFWVLVKALQSVATTAGEAKQTASVEVNTDWLVFDLKHAGYGIAVNENSLVLSYCTGTDTTNPACSVKNSINPARGKLLLVKETTNIADTNCPSDDPDFGFGFVLWNGSQVVYQETPCDVCGLYKDYIKCIWHSSNKIYNGTRKCCNGLYSDILVGYPIDTNSTCKNYSSNKACCSKQSCTGITWYLSPSTSTPITNCFQGTYVLYRKTTNSTGGFQNAKPIINCVSDWDIWFGLDINGDNTVDKWVNEIPNTDINNNADLKNKLKIAKIYLLVQASYTPQANYNFCKETAHDCDNTCGNGYILAEILKDADNSLHTVCLKHPSNPNWVHYKWRIVTIPVTGFFNIP